MIDDNKIPSRSRRSPRCMKALLLGSALLVCLLPSCSDPEPEARVIGSFLCTRLAHSFIQDQAGVEFSQVQGSQPDIRSFTTNLDSRIAEWGNRRSFTSDRDFTMELTLERVPENSHFTTAFGIPMDETKRVENLSADYGILVNGRLVKRKRIDAFTKPEDRTWYVETIHLDPLAGKPVKIQLLAKVQPPDQKVIRGWADPRVIVSGQQPWTDATPERPNLIVVLVDTLRADNLGCYGYGRETSPHLDAFADAGLLYENAIAPASWTWPTTASVLTGQYPLHHGVLDAFRCTLGMEKTTLAEACSRAGMKTAAFVANLIISKSRNFDQGFTTFRSMNWSRAGAMVDAFEKWVEKTKEGRFMAYLHFIDPHSPYEPPDEYVSRFSDPKDEHRLPESEFGKIRGQVNSRSRDVTKADRLAVGNALDRYDAEILYWDEQFGRMLKTLKRLGLMENTIIAVTSDHGEEFLEHGYIGHGLSLYDTSLRVPMVLCGPGIEPGRVKEQVQLISLMPTLLEAIRVDPGDAIFDGPSLFAENAFDLNRLAYSHTAHALSDNPKIRCDLFSLRTEKWKLHYDPGRDRILLYGLNGDLGELSNLASLKDYKKTGLQLRSALQKWINEYEALSSSQKHGAGSERKMDEETINAFQQLGYIGDY